MVIIVAVSIWLNLAHVNRLVDFSKSVFTLPCVLPFQVTTREFEFKPHPLSLMNEAKLAFVCAREYVSWRSFETL